MLGREGADDRTAGRFYVAVVQAVILFGLETWAETPYLEKALASSHHRAVQWMASMVLERQLYKTRVYSPIGVVLATVLLDDIRVYIARLQNTVTQYIMTRPIMELCLAAERRPVIRLLRRWWEQPPLYILGIRAGHTAA